MDDRVCFAIDLKSFYASVECRERGLDPLDALLVVADEKRTDKTICLAVTAALKQFGVRNRCRLFEARQACRAINTARLANTRGGRFSGTSSSAAELTAHPDWSLSMIVAPPHMARYIQYSAKIYSVYAGFVAPEDILVYSIDEVFMDLTRYRRFYGDKTPEQLAREIVQAVFRETGITATVGIGSNFFLAKVAMDILAKHMQPDGQGARIATLTEESFRRTLWTHRPLTDFWRIGPGIANRLESHGMFTLGDIARTSLRQSPYLYRLFGKNAELLIDHAWGREPCTMEAIKQYRPSNRCLNNGQVLSRPYAAEEARLVLREMADQLSLRLVENDVLAGKIGVSIGYEQVSMRNRALPERFVSGHCGPIMPPPSQGVYRFPAPTSSTRLFLQAADSLFDQVADRAFPVRRLNLTAFDLVSPEKAATGNAVHETFEQLDFFVDTDAMNRARKEEAECRLREHNLQKSILSLQKKYGKNAILRGMNLQEGATGRERNLQIGGHQA
ncbi:MAG: DNA methylase [Kiritimatiellia bacterium]